MNAPIKSADSSPIPQQVQPHIELSPQVQAELAILNVRYRDLQETMSRLITLLATENTELKQQLAKLQNKQTQL